MNPSNLRRALKIMANPTLNYSILSEGIETQYLVWLGRRMGACLPRAQWMIPSGCGMDRRDDNYTLSRSIKVPSTVWPGRQMGACLPRAQWTKPSGCGMDRRGDA